MPTIAGAKTLTPFDAAPDIPALARAWIGTPYVLGAALRGVGCDCVGLVRGVLSEATGAPLVAAPPWRQDWAAPALSPLLGAAQAHLHPAPAGTAPAPGDVVAFRGQGRVAHCGIVVAPGRVVHAVEGRGVVEVTLDPAQVAFAARFPV